MNEDEIEFEELKVWLVNNEAKAAMEWLSIRQYFDRLIDIERDTYQKLFCWFNCVPPLIRNLQGGDGRTIF